MACVTRQDVLEAGHRLGRHRAAGGKDLELAEHRRHVGIALGQHSGVLERDDRVVVAPEHVVGAPQHEPAVDVVGLRLEALGEPGDHLLDIGHAALGHGRRGRQSGALARGDRLVFDARRAEPQIEAAGNQRQRDDDGEGGDQACGVGRARFACVLGGRRGEQAALDLEPRAVALLGADDAALEVDVELAQLVAVDLDVIAGARRNRAVAAQQRHGDERQGRHRHGAQGDEQQHRQPSSISASRRRRTSAVSGAATAVHEPWRRR